MYFIMNYYVNPRTQILMLQILSLVFIFIIIMMISYHSMETSELKNDINNIEIPSCPACPACPSCPGCPSTNIDMKDHNIEDKINLECPSCPSCPSCQTDAPTYPTVEDIVGGIFPGRNMGLTRGGIYQTLDSSGSYELLPEYDFYKPEDAFPKDSILRRAVGDIEKDKLIFDNSYDSMNVDTRMNTGLNGLGEDSLQASINRQDESGLRMTPEVVNAVPVDDSEVSGGDIIEAQVIMEGGP